MEKDTGYRENSSQEDSEPVSEGLTFGWCLDCTCVAHYHVGADDGHCLDCGCKSLVPDPDSDILARIAHHVLPELAADEGEDEEEFAPVTLVLEELPIVNIFMGLVSRACKRCSKVKLYAEFNDSRSQGVLCRLCAAEVDQAVLRAALSEYDRAVLDYMEEDILENELAYEEALERQDWIDEMLRLMED